MGFADPGRPDDPRNPVRLTHGLRDQPKWLSVAVPRDRDVERPDKRVSRIDIGASLLKTPPDGPPGRDERGVELLARVVICESQDDGGPPDRKLLDISSHWRPHALSDTIEHKNLEFAT